MFSRFARQKGHVSRSRSWGAASLIMILSAVLMIGSAVGYADPEEYGFISEPRENYLRANPPLPDASVFPLQMVIDDDNSETVFGLTGSTARQFLWFNHFDNPGPFYLHEIWVLFPSSADVPLGGDIQLVIYVDPDGDPLNGATLEATYDGVIQAADGDTFSIYSLPTPLFVDGSGDVLIGVVNRYFINMPPPTLPATLDTTLSQNRSYIALWAADPPAAPDLSSATTIDVLDGTISGNFMIRGFGTFPRGPAIPLLSPLGMILFIALMALVGIGYLRVH